MKICKVFIRLFLASFSVLLCLTVAEKKSYALLRVDRALYVHTTRISKRNLFAVCSHVRSSNFLQKKKTFHRRHELSIDFLSKTNKQAVKTARVVGAILRTTDL